MTNYTVDFGRVQAVLAEMQMVDKQIKTMLDTLESNTERNLSQWQSGAKESYRQCKAKWDNSAAQMPQLLAQARRALTEIMTNYGRADNAGTDMWLGLNVGSRR